MKCKRCPKEIDSEIERTGSGFCRACYLTEVYPKRKARSILAYQSRERINEVYAEMRAAIAERDRYRRDAEQIKARIRREAIESLVTGGALI